MEDKYFRAILDAADGDNLPLVGALWRAAGRDWQARYLASPCTAAR